jgi:drug/metabolite transporter (DMT)-like permease
VETVLALAAAALYGSADFLGGAASRRASAFAVLAVAAPAGAVVMLAAALVSGGLSSGGFGAGGSGVFGGLTLAGASWAVAAGACGALGLIAFYAGFAVAPMSVVAPVTALVATVLPVGSAIAEGEHVAPTVAVGVLICVAAVVLVSVGPSQPATRRLRGVCYAFAAGVAFGLFFLFLRNAGASGVIWPVALSRAVGAVIALACCAVTRTRPLGRRGSETLGIALVSGAVDASANVCYVLATRAGLFGLAVVLTSLYPGVTVLLARIVLGERMLWMQRLGLLLAAAGVILVTVLPACPGVSRRRRPCP